LHPQWLAFRGNYKSILALENYIHGLVVDIGCGRKEVRKYLPKNCNYIGLDNYHTSTKWYKSQPEVYSDAHALPFKTESIDTVILLDVLEHLSDTEKCLSEIRRVLIKKGVLILQVPFIYPVHDAPLDFYRWTIFGIRKIIERNNLVVVKETYQGNPADTSFLLLNIALSKIILNWIKQRNPASLLVVLLPFVILFNNIAASLMTLISPPDQLMPFGYRIIVEKS
jgi:SAM-dependent methyltransferase